MKHTSLVYELQSGWRVGNIRLTTEKSARVSSKDVKDAMAWMYPAEPNYVSLPTPDELMADMEDKIPRILYDDDGQLIVAMPANPNSSDWSLEPKRADRRSALPEN